MLEFVFYDQLIPKACCTIQCRLVSQNFEDKATHRSEVKYRDPPPPIHVCHCSAKIQCVFVGTICPSRL